MRNRIRSKRSNVSGFFRKVRISPNTLVLFKKDNVTEEALNELAKIISDAKIPNVVLMTVDDVNAVAALPQEEMERHGWFRAEALIKSIRRNQNVAKANANAGNTGEPTEPVSRPAEYALEGVGESVPDKE